MNRSKEKLPFKSAFLLILTVTLLISGSTAVGLCYYFHLKNQRRHDEAYQIIAIVQDGPFKETFRTVYFAELLGLSVDKPKNLYDFNIEFETQKLLTSPLIKTASIKKIKPGTIIINYIPRMPIAYLGDFSNTAIDEEGFLIPFKPFFSPKKLPVIYLGGFEDQLAWGTQIDASQKANAIKTFTVLSKFAMENGLSLQSLDLSKSQQKSLGKCEIVAALKGGSHNWLLRLTPEDYEYQLARFRELHNNLNMIGDLQEFNVVDLRIPKIALIKNLDDTNM